MLAYTIIFMKNKRFLIRNLDIILRLTLDAKYDELGVALSWFYQKTHPEYIQVHLSQTSSAVKMCLSYGTFELTELRVYMYR